MPRVCSREGCCRRLVGKDGSADYRRHFCSPECKNADKREKMQAKRKQVKDGRCPLCGHKRVNDSSDGLVPCHTDPASRNQSASEGRRPVGPAGPLGREASRNSQSGNEYPVRIVPA